MIPSLIFSLPKFFPERLEFDGWRACAPTVPGCVVIHRDREKANALAVIAVKALIEENYTDESIS